MVEMAPVRGESWQRYSSAQRWLFLVILILVGTSAAVDKGLLPILFQPIKDEFHISDAMLGLLGGMPFAVCYALSSIPLARLADLHGRKRVLILSMLGWSVMTVLCGIVPTLILLFVTRMGVGLAEGGSYPPAHALLAEYFSPQQMALALALFTATSSIGYMLASSLGGWLEMAYGWRTTFVIMGLSAAPVAVLAWVVLREAAPAGAAAAARDRPANLRDELRNLFTKRTMRLVMLALVVFAIYPYGLIVFTPTYMVRLFDMSLAEAGPLFGLSVAAGQLSGSILGGALADRLRARDERWMLWVPALAVGSSIGIAMLAFSRENVTAFLVLGGLGIAAASAAIPPAYAVVQHVCGNRRRATASALAVIMMHAVGAALAPLLIGVLSDLFHPAAGDRSLRYAILAATPLLIVSAWAFWSAARSLKQDAER